MLHPLIHPCVNPNLPNLISSLNPKPLSPQGPSSLTLDRGAAPQNSTINNRKTKRRSPVGVHPLGAMASICMALALSLALSLACQTSLATYMERSPLALATSLARDRASYSPHVIFEKGLYRTSTKMAFIGLKR